MALYLIDQHRQESYPLEKIIVNYSMENYAKAIQDMKEGRTIKAVLTW